MTSETCVDVEPKRYRCCKTLRAKGGRAWCRKFFCEGQLHNKTHEEALFQLSKDWPLHKRLLTKHRRAIGFILPGLFVHIFWWAFFIKKDLWHLYVDGYPMVITMVFGSLIAGMTSEGGGAVAFPVMTLVLSISPSIARDFSIMIQAFGMTCAAMSIIFMRIRLEWSSIIFCSMGSWLGMALGFHVIDPAMTPPQKKMFFVSIWFSFAFALFLLNRYHKRKTFQRIPDMCFWKGLVLLFTGVFGGIFTSFAGSGLDICSFSILTLLFRVSEKVATPTSVILMGGASIFGFYWRTVMMTETPDELAWNYLAVCIPVVVLGAPCGALIGSHFHRLVLASLVYILDTVALVAAFVLIPQGALLSGVSVALIVAGLTFFLFITFMGQKLMTHVDTPPPRITRRETSPNLGDLSSVIDSKTDIADVNVKYPRRSTLANINTANGTSGDLDIFAKLNGKNSILGKSHASSNGLDLHVGNGCVNQAFNEKEEDEATKL